MPIFEKPPVKLSPDAVVVVFTAYNEFARIPYFLQYYRELGVDHFFAIDNNSTDETAEYLKKQRDVTYFYTTESYAGSKSGRLWTTEIARHYALNRWCLTLDVDELLVFPGCESSDIKQLCAYLDEHGYDGIYTIFLDLYSGGPLSGALYTPGQPFTEVCPYFDSSGYRIQRSVNFPPIQIFGGPRQRVFWQEGKSGNGPSMRKMPLVKWREDFDYVFSTHSSTPISLADVTGATLHFKFFSTFKDFSAAEVVRGDRTQTEHYKLYSTTLAENDISFFNETSVEYRDSYQLVTLGLLSSSRRYVNFIANQIKGKKGGALSQNFKYALNDAAKEDSLARTIGVTQLASAWKLIHREFDAGVAVIDGPEVIGWFLDRAWPVIDVEIEAWSGGRVVAQTRTQTSLKDSRLPKGFLGHGFLLKIPLSETVLGLSRKIEIRAKGVSRPFAEVSVRGRHIQRAARIVAEFKSIRSKWVSTMRRRRSAGSTHG